MSAANTPPRQGCCHNGQDARQRQDEQHGQDRCRRRPHTEDEAL